MKGEPVVWAALTLLGLVMAGAALGYGVTKEGGQVGPGFLPVVAGVLLAVLSGIALAKSVKEPGRPDDVDRGKVRTLWTVFGMLLGALLLVPVAGFLVAFAALVLAISAFVEKRPVLPSLGVAVAASVVIYAVFVLFLDVPLPGGVLGIGGEG